MWELEKFKNNSAIVDEFGTTVTYDELGKYVDEITRHINKRCLVFLLCENSIGSIVGYVASINKKIVPAMLNAYLEKELLKELLLKYMPEYIWLPKELLGEFETKKVEYECFGYALVKYSSNQKYEIYDELCLLLTTSGSTGSPKFVRQSYENVYANAMAIVEYLELDENERPITTLPMNYTYGLSIINSHLMVGATILVTNKGLMQKEFWTFFKDQKATSFGGVPYTYEMLDRLRFYRMDLPNLRYMTQAGGKITEELHRKFAEYALNSGKKFIVMYGQCEATARMGYLPADKALEKCGSMGIAIPGGTFRIIDTTGRNINEPHMTGELVYEGPNVTLGYAENINDLAKADERKGVLHTGDMAQFDEDGYYYIVGRKKRFLKIYGNRVNLDEIDRMIKGQFDNIDVASAGTDDHMYIFITDDGLKESVREFVIKKTKLNPVAFKVIVIDQIPKNDSGKTLFKALEVYYK